MPKRAHMPSWLVWTLLIALVATRVSGVHLHLCFDGQQPQVSVQSGLAGLDAPDTEHADKDTDVSLVRDALVKNLDSKGVLPVLLVAAVLLFILDLSRKSGIPVRLLRLAIPVAPGFHLRPPLRGPPP